MRMDECGINRSAAEYSGLELEQCRVDGEFGVKVVAGVKVLRKPLEG